MFARTVDNRVVTQEWLYLWKEIDLTVCRVSYFSYTFKKVKVFGEPKVIFYVKHNQQHYTLLTKSEILKASEDLKAQRYGFELGESASSVSLLSVIFHVFI